MFMPTDFRRAASNDTHAPRPILRLPATGLTAGTLVETAQGWQPVESLAIGQPVQTWDGGLQPLARLERKRIAPGAALLRVPGGVLSACSDMLLLPGQHVLVDTGEAAEALDQDVALVPAAALDGYEGIVRERLSAGLDVVTLAFDAEEIVYANTGALLHCPAAAAVEASAPRSDFFTVLGIAEARALLGLSAPTPGAPAVAPLVLRARVRAA